MGLAVDVRAPELLERDSELRMLEDALGGARQGRGSATLVEGHAGTGKSRLLAEVAARAERAGMQVLRARGEDAEREFAFGVALQLFEEPVRSAEPDERARLLSGAARLAGPLLDAETTTSPADPQGFFSLVYGLYWLTQGLADGRPLLLVVDDAQWADVPSLRLLAYLSHRLDDLPIALVVAYRPGEGPSGAAPVSALAPRGARTLALEPLSPGAAAQLVHERIPGASERFCAACADVTAGNPFYLDELLRTVAAEDMPASDEGVAQVSLLAPDTVSQSILLRLSRLPSEAAALAQAVAVLGEAPLCDAASLAKLDLDAAVPVATALAAVGVLGDREPLSFSHPIVRGVVYADAPEARRGRMHLHAAELMRAAGAPAERVSAHLLAAPPVREAWVIEPLRIAAAHALASGAPESAVRYLRRALGEPPPPEARADVLAELGQAEAAVADPGAPDRLRAALALHDEPLARARVQLMLGRALSAQGRLVEAADAFEQGAADARGRDADLVADLEAGYLGVARLDPRLYPVAAERIERLVAQPPAADRPGQRPLLADVALARAWAGAPAADVRPLCDRAWAGGALLAEQGPDGHPVYILSGALMSIDELELELVVLDAALREAQACGSVMAVATASYCRSVPLYFQARIPDSLADAEQAVRSERDGWELFLPTARGYYALGLMERGELRAAERALAELREPERWLESLPYAPYLDARARLHLAQRRPREALADAYAEGRLLEETFGGTMGRGVVQWRCVAALAADALGEHDRARALCDEELELARAGDRPREIGAALRTAAILARDERRIGLLEEAAETLERSQSVLELLRALVDLGAAMRRAGRRQAARKQLERALDVASSRGATALAQRAREELLATGARPRRTALRGVESLTPSELRVARLAADGLRNREIAEALFVTGKTVDYHLRHVYQKLGGGREGLARALAAKP
jgi:DNA-binding CsgD family transcriptional regulator